MVSLNQMPPDEDRGPLLKGTTWAITGAAVVVVILRLFARTIMRNSAGFDDVLMVIALVRFTLITLLSRALLICPLRA